jgi:hypothetical protein
VEKKKEVFMARSGPVAENRRPLKSDGEQLKFITRRESDGKSPPFDTHSCWHERLPSNQDTRTTRFNYNSDVLVSLTINLIPSSRTGTPLPRKVIIVVAAAVRWENATSERTYVRRRTTRTVGDG